MKRIDLVELRRHIKWYQVPHWGRDFLLELIDQHEKRTATLHAANDKRAGNARAVVERAIDQALPLAARRDTPRERWVGIVRGWIEGHLDELGIKRAVSPAAIRAALAAVEPPPPTEAEAPAKAPAVLQMQWAPPDTIIDGDLYKAPYKPNYVYPSASERGVKSPRRFVVRRRPPKI